MSQPILQNKFSKNTVLTIFVTLFFISLFVFILMRWNKCTDSLSNIDSKETFSADPSRITNKKVKFANRSELFQNPEVKSKAADVFAALEAFSNAKNKAEGIVDNFKDRHKK